MRAVLEDIEWDDIWWERTGDAGKPRVLYIGDSISRDIRPRMARLAGGEILFDGYATSKAVDNPFFIEGVSLFARQEKARSLVLFNNGLHGFHLHDRGTYRSAYEDLLRRLGDVFSGTRMAVVLTTAMGDMRNERVIARNESAAAAAGKCGLPVIDLYAPSFAICDMHRDPYHFAPEGGEILAGHLLGAVRALLAGGQPFNQ